MQQVCNDKNIASEVLKEEDIPSVYHVLFYGTVYAAVYWRKRQLESTFSRAREGNACLQGQLWNGRQSCFKVRTQAELEKAASDIYKSSEAMAVCRYEDIQSEYRLVVLDGEIRLAFSKIRPSLTGDGVSTVGKLLAEAIAKGQIHSFLVPNEAELSKVPAKDETYLLNWKHNLGQGASALALSIPDLEEELVSLVKKTAKH